MENQNTYDITVVGGGIVGVATAYKIQLKYPQLKVIVFEKEQHLAFHQTLLLFLFLVTLKIKI